MQKYYFLRKCIDVMDVFKFDTDYDAMSFAAKYGMIVFKKIDGIYTKIYDPAEEVGS
jgi:hypothetical protein